MKNRILKMAVSFALLTGMALLLSQCESNATDMVQMDAMALVVPPGNGEVAEICSCLESNYPMEELSVAEKEALLFMREEEKLARDVYLKMNEKWQVRIFSNISKAEQRHMDAVLCLIEKYDLTDPVGDNAAGVFQNDALQTLYNSLVADGEQSLEKALLAGATIEDRDIGDLVQRMEDDDNEDILAVFGALKKGSGNHMRAFNRNLENKGVTYAPVYISQEMFDEIIASPHEAGGSICGICFGNGQGNGPGNGNCDGTGPHGNGGGTGNGGGNCDGTGPHGNGGGNGNGGGGNGGGHHGGGH